MKLLTKAIERRLLATPIKSTEGRAPEKIPILVKFFDPCGRYTLYVTEAEQLPDGDWHLWGYCVSPLGPDCDEFGYTLLSELAAIRRPFGLRIERDRHPVRKTLADVLPGEVA